MPNASFGATVTDTLKNEIVTKLWGQYLDLAALERNFSAKYGPNHLAVVNLRDRMREIRTNISQELKRLGETFKSDYEIAKQREQETAKELASAVSKSQLTDVNAIALTELDSTAQSSKRVLRKLFAALYGICSGGVVSSQRRESNFTCDTTAEQKQP